MGYFVSSGPAVGMTEPGANIVMVSGVRVTGPKYECSVACVMFLWSTRESTGAVSAEGVLIFDVWSGEKDKLRGCWWKE